MNDIQIFIANILCSAFQIKTTKDIKTNQYTFEKTTEQTHQKVWYLLRLDKLN